MAAASAHRWHWSGHTDHYVFLGLMAGYTVGSGSSDLVTCAGP